MYFFGKVWTVFGINVVQNRVFNKAVTVDHFIVLQSWAKVPKKNPTNSSLVIS